MSQSFKCTLEDCTTWESPEEGPVGRVTLPRSAEELGGEVDCEKHVKALCGLKRETLQRSHRVTDFSVKAQLDSIMHSWDLKIFEYLKID